MDEHETHNKEEHTKKPATKKRMSRGVRIAVAALGGLVILSGLFVLHAYLMTPSSIRKPAFQHYHFRMQILVNGSSIDFAGKEFQTPAGHDVCNADLTKSPIHFHDNKDQMVHIHWDGITGGQVLKYYGWNYIGGQHGALGTRFDQLPKLINVPIHGNALPQIPNGDKFYVYIGDENGYKQKSFDDFTHQDLEKFFNKKSNLPEQTTSLLDKLFPKASAHAGHEHIEGASIDPKQEELKKINNLLGNVVIFVQKDKPSSELVESAFEHLEPLSLSSCAG
ncbi:MAG TPA: hypothetical protein VLA92_01585 [Candidatus Saccharimonadales bacterium]|nr:hypothetical protein [Candidatus Saccharimonadales bacterium]